MPLRPACMHVCACVPSRATATVPPRGRPASLRSGGRQPGEPLRQSHGKGSGAPAPPFVVDLRAGEAGCGCGLRQRGAASARLSAAAGQRGFLRGGGGSAFWATGEGRLRLEGDGAEEETETLFYHSPPTAGRGADLHPGKGTEMEEGPARRSVFSAGPSDQSEPPKPPPSPRQLQVPLGKRFQTGRKNCAPTPGRFLFFAHIPLRSHCPLPVHNCS